MQHRLGHSVVFFPVPWVCTSCYPYRGEYKAFENKSIDFAKLRDKVKNPGIK